MFATKRFGCYIFKMKKDRNCIINEFILQNVLKQTKTEGTQLELTCRYMSYTSEVNKVFTLNSIILD